MKSALCVLACLLAVAGVHADGLLFVYGNMVLAEEAVFTVEGCSLSVAANGESFTIWQVPVPGPEVPYVLEPEVTKDNFGRHLSQAVLRGEDPVAFAEQCSVVVESLVVRNPRNFIAYFRDGDATLISLRGGGTSEGRRAITVEEQEEVLHFFRRQIEKELAAGSAVFISKPAREWSRPRCHVIESNQVAQVTAELLMIYHGRDDRVVLLRSHIDEIRNPQ